MPTLLQYILFVDLVDDDFLRIASVALNECPLQFEEWRHILPEELPLLLRLLVIAPEPFEVAMDRFVVFMGLDEHARRLTGGKFDRNDGEYIRDVVSLDHGVDMHC